MNGLADFSVANLAKFWRYCRIYGFKNATRLAFRRLKKPMGVPPPDVTPLSIAVSENLVPLLDKTVSVVIPAKNAAQYLEHLVAKLRAQQGIRPCEIILVDSGSTDGTVALAEREGVRVVQILPAEFTHSFSRNTGAGTATGEYLLFMVQDALPLTNLWLCEMVTALESNQLVAVSCAEYPRADCDLFYGFLIHRQYDSAPNDQDRILGWNESCSSYMGLRSSAQISDVAALVRRDVFEKYRYRTAYAEDLDLGIRLIRDGHKLGFLNSTRVLHSHNRSSYYFLKRGYVDARFLVDVFPNLVYPEVEAGGKLLADILMMWNCIGQITPRLETLKFPLTTSELMERILAILESPRTQTNPEPEAGGSELGSFMQQLWEQTEMAPVESSAQTNMVRPHIIAHCERLGEWICSIYDVANSQFATQIVSAVEKMFTLHSGTHLAYLYLTLERQSKLDEALTILDKLMITDV